MKKSIAVLSFLILGAMLYAQGQTGTSPFGIKFSGYIKNDFILDTRQSVTIREGHFLLWPEPELMMQGVDVNKNLNFNFLAVQTRVSAAITGPDAFGAKTSGTIEGEFFGTSDADINGFRLRHAFLKLSWEKTELLFGQYWHPMFITDCFPGTVSVNTGAPFQPFARNPQIRLTRSLGKVKFTAVAFSQRDFTSSGGSIQIRNSGTPEVHTQVAYKNSNSEAGTEFVAGAGVGYKTIVPRLYTPLNYPEKEKVGSMITQAFVKVKVPAVTIKAEAVYGQNTYDVLGISSYAVVSSDLVTGKRTYKPLASWAAWTDIQTNGSKVQAGIFAGYTANLGAGEPVLNITSGTRSNIEYVRRIAPRVVFISGKVQIAYELEFTNAAFGSYGPEGKPENSTPVTNIRNLVAAFYYF